MLVFCRASSPLRGHRPQTQTPDHNALIWPARHPARQRTKPTTGPPAGPATSCLCQVACKAEAAGPACGYVKCQLLVWTGLMRRWCMKWAVELLVYALGCRAVGVCMQRAGALLPYALGC